jgi:uncharacterized membrane-anchored protein
MKRWILVAWVLGIGVSLAGIVGKERLLAQGNVVFLKLAPVDPRSLMQGDYMALHFAVADAITRAREDGHKAGAAPNAGVAVIRVDERGEAAFVRLHDGEPLAAGEALLRFQNRPARWGRAQTQISTDAYFFQEGQARRYEAAQFGEFRVAPDGEAVLVGLRGKGLGRL